MRTCQKCEAEVERDDKFCPECGEKVVKEARKITVSTIFKTIALVIFFIILVNVLKSSNVVMSIPIILFIILFLVWSGILNSLLKKLFNAEISTGVKIVITLVIALIFVIGMRQASTMKVAPVMFRPIEGNDMSSFVDRLNNVMNTRDYSLLTAMMEEGAITPEVVKDIRILINNQKDFNIIFKFQGQNVNDNKIDVNVIVIIKTGYGERMEGTQFFFERTDRGWMLFAIEPRLSDIKLEKSFEEETAYNLKKIPKPADEVDLQARVGTSLNLANYPAPYVVNGVYDESNIFVVGARADAADSIAVADIASGLQVESKTCMTFTTGGEETCTVVEITPVTKLDTEITGSEQYYNLILVSTMDCCWQNSAPYHPCNRIVEEFGLTCDSWTLKPGEGIIQLAKNGNKAAMIVAGTTNDDTRRAAKVVLNYKDYTLKGNQVIVKGTTINEATVE